RAAHAGAGRRGPRRTRRARARVSAAPGAVPRPARLAPGGGGVLERPARCLQGARGALAAGPGGGATDSVSVTTVVAIAPDAAFEVFTSEVDAWWRHGRRFRTGTGSVMRFEPGVGGRLLELQGDGAKGAYELGRVRVWDPPKRLVFDFLARVFERGERTEVEVRFEEVEHGTRVTVEHRGWDALRPDHPVRHGLGTGDAFLSMMGLWWGGLLVEGGARAGRGGAGAAP